MSAMKWYIAGSIDNNPDFGASMRAKVRELLDSIGIDYFCPALSEANQRHMEQKESLKDILRHAGEGWREALSTQIMDIVEDDLDGLRNCGGVIVILDQYIGSGTASECTVAHEYNMPVLGFFVDNEDPHQVSPWTLSRVTEFCDGLEGIKEAVERYEREYQP